jgi:hypothetical protein
LCDKIEDLGLGDAPRSISRLSHHVAHLTPEKVGLSTAAKVLDLKGIDVVANLLRRVEAGAGQGFAPEDRS